jgi:hypothetical protein
MEEKCPEVIDALGFAPIGLDEPYRIIVQNSPVNYIDPEGFEAIAASWPYILPALPAISAGGVAIAAGGTVVFFGQHQLQMNQIFLQRYLHHKAMLLPPESFKNTLRMLVPKGSVDKILMIDANG